MKVFSVEVLLVATAYIRAADPDEAARLAREAFTHPANANVTESTYFGAVPVHGGRLDDPGLPVVSLSPALTFYGRAVDEVPTSFGPSDLESADA